MKLKYICISIILLYIGCKKSFDPLDMSSDIYGKWQGKNERDNIVYDVKFEFSRQNQYRYTKYKNEYNYKVQKFGIFNILTDNLIEILIDSSEFNNQITVFKQVDTLIIWLDHNFLQISEKTRSLIQLSGDKNRLTFGEFYYSELHDHVNYTYWHYMYYFKPDSVYLYYTVTNNPIIPDKYDFTFKFECSIEDKKIAFQRHDGVNYQRGYVFDRDKLYMGGEPIDLNKF